MAWNFRKSIKLGGGFRLNLSKKGPGISFSVKGARIGVGPRGIRKTVSIPGTGIYNTKTISWKKRSTKKVPTTSAQLNQGLTNSTDSVMPAEPALINHKNSTPQNIKWYQKTGWIIFFLIFIFPLGLFLLWRFKKWPNFARGIVTVIFGFFFIIMLLAVIGGGNSNAVSSTTSSKLPAVVQQAISQAGSSVAPTVSSPSPSSSSEVSAVSPALVSSSDPAPSSSPTPAAPSKATTQSANISLANLSSSVSPGDEARISIKGQPNTKYTIAVNYSSGISKAASLEDKTSDSNGNISWSWKVGAKTKSGTYNINVRGGGKTFTTSFTVG
jgi:hypothetical protein